MQIIVFSTASIKKSHPIGIMDKINKGDFEYHQPPVYRDSLALSGFDVTANLKDTAKLSWPSNYADADHQR